MNSGSFAPAIADKDRVTKMVINIDLINFKNMASPHNMTATH
jgi:hypothetical protein